MLIKLAILNNQFPEITVFAMKKFQNIKNIPTLTDNQ